MKSEPLLLSAIHFIEKSAINSGMLNSAIINLATPANEMYYTPGTAAYTEDYKTDYWEIEFGFSFPGKITDALSDQIIGTAAIVLKTDSGRNILIYKNDVFSNAPLIPQIQSNFQKTIVKYGINTLYQL